MKPKERIRLVLFNMDKVKKYRGRSKERKSSKSVVDLLIAGAQPKVRKSAIAHTKARARARMLHRTARGSDTAA